MIKRRFEFARATKNKIRFNELAGELDAQVSGTFYLCKAVWASLGSPEVIELTIEEAK